MATIAEIRRKYPQYNDLSDRQLADSLRTKFYSDIPEDEFFRRVGLGGTDVIDDVQRGAGQAIAAVGSALRDVPIPQVSALGQKAEEYGNKVVQANPADMPSVQEIKSVRDAVNFAGERVAEIIPQAVAPLAAAGLATLAGATAPIAGAASFGVGALSGFGQAYGGIRERQREQGIEDKARAAAFATPSAALDALGVGRFIPGSKRILGDIIETGLKGIAKTGARVGTEEGVTEVAQTGLERAGAFKSLTDEEAQAEYLNALAAGAVGGGGIGAGGATVRTVVGRPAIEESASSGRPEGDTPPGAPEVATGESPRPPEPPPATEGIGVPATPFGEAPVRAPRKPEPIVTVEDETVVIEQPDGSIEIIPRAEWEARQGPAAAPVAGEAPGTFRTTVNLNGEERSVEGPTPRPAPRPAPAPAAEAKPMAGPREGPAPGFVRVYHGGSPLESGETGRMFTTSREYAEGHASEFPEGAEVLYIDLPKNDPRITPEYPDQGPERGFTFNPQLTAEEMKSVRSLGRPAPRPAPAPPSAPETFVYNPGPKPKPFVLERREPAPAPAPRPAPAPENIRTVTTPGGTKVDTAFEVVDAADLRAATGDLQNRDRSRAATDVQVQDIFSNFDPARLGDSQESDRGSPIIGPDNVVESGNGRVMAINKVYDESPERAKAYRDFIESQGFSTAGMQRPVLVRRRVTEMAPDQRSQFVRESNMDTKLRLSTSEQAGADAAALTADVMGLMRSPDVNQAVNRDFVRGFLSKLPPQEQAGFIDKDGMLSAEGSRRLRTAIKASAYGDADLINTLDESQDNNIKSIGGALEDVAPEWRRLRDAVAEGQVRPEMDVTDRLVEAAKIVRDMRNRGQKVEEFLAQQDAFNPLNPLTERFIRSFYNEKTGRALGRDAIADKLGKYARRAAEQTTEDQLFAAEQLSPEQILDGIAEPEEGGLFDQAEAAPLVAPEPEIPVITDELPARLKQPKAQTKEQEEKAKKFNRGLAAAIKTGNMGVVADYLANKGTLPTTREFMGRARNLIRTFEQMGIGNRITQATAGKPVNVLERLLKSDDLGINLSLPKADADKLRLSEMNVALRDTSGVNEKTAVHEILHAVTIPAIKYPDRFPEGSGVRKAAEDLRDLAEKVAKVLKSGDPNKVPLKYAKLRDYLATPEEILTWGLTDYDFQQFMKTIPVKSGNAFTEFVKYVGRLLGVSEGKYNALTRLIEISESLIPADAAAMADVARGFKAFQEGPSVLDLKGKAGNLPANQAVVIEEAERIPSLSRGVRKLLKMREAGRIDDGEFAYYIADLAEYIGYMKDGRNYRLAQKGRARGADRIMEVLLREKRNGNLSPEAVDFMAWVLKGNPNLAEDLGISVRTPKEGSPAGEYNHVSRLMRLFKERASDTTAVHEMLHHTERMMPPDVQQAIRVTWLREFNKAAAKGKSDPRINTFFQALRALHSGTKFTVGNETFPARKGWDIAMNLLEKGVVPYSYYQYVNPSEFWAVNATDIMRKRFDVKDSTLGRIRNWLSELVEKAKGLFNLSATSPLIKALDSLAKADGKFNSLTMLQESENARYMDISPKEERPRLALPKETRAQGFARKLIDRFERMRVVQSIGQLSEGAEGFYEAARKFDSRAGELMQKFDRDYFRPIQKIMKEAGLNLDTVDFYLYARAAPARNARLQAKAEAEIRAKMEAEEASEAEIDAAIEQAYEDGTIPTAGSGITTEEARDVLLGFEGLDYYPALQKIGELFNAANKERMENNIKAGLVSREEGERLLREEPDYVPMKGFAADENLAEPAEDFESTMGYGGTGFGVSTREWYEARGRSNKPFSPLGTFISDVETSIVRGERNRVGQKLMDFFAKNPSDAWRVFSYRNPPRDRNGNVQRPSPFDPNFMVVKRGGQTFYLRIDDPLLAKAAKNLNPPQMGKLLQISSNVTRLLSRSFTTANPDFFVPNFFRDLQSAALNLGAESPGLAKAFAKNVKDKKAFRSIAAFEYGRPGGDAALRKQYEQFKLDGGSVSWAQRETPQEASARIIDDLKTLDDRLQDIKDAKGAKETIDALWKPASKPFRAMVGALESTNAIFENGIRFAAYRAALDVGMTREQAAMVAREATVDFNRRGEAGAILNALYAFFNAGIQGSVRTARALANNPFKTGKLSTTQAALLGMMGTAATLAAANAGISDEDDDGKLFWDKIPDYEKERNLIIMNPVDGKSYVKIPMPYGFGFFPYLATRTMDAARRGDDLGAAGLDIVTAALGNFSPVQFSAGSVQSSALRAATPTMFKPLTELAVNENFMGKPIYNEPFDKGQSYASVARYNTPEGYKDLSRFLNDISGGEGKVKGGMNFPPESFEYLIEFGLGGVTQLAKSLYKTGAEGEPLAAPVVRRLVGQPGKGRNVGEFYEREEKARVVNQQMKDLTGVERRKLIEKFPTETHPRIQSALTSTRSAVRKLNEERKRIQKLDMDEGTKAERLEALRERIDGEFVRFNRVYNQVEEATR